MSFPLEYEFTTQREGFKVEQIMEQTMRKDMKEHIFFFSKKPEGVTRKGFCLKASVLTCLNKNCDVANTLINFINGPNCINNLINDN